MALELIVNLLLIAGGIFCFVNVSTTMPHSAVNELGAEQWPQAILVLMLIALAFNVIRFFKINKKEDIEAAFKDFFPAIGRFVKSKLFLGLSAFRCSPRGPRGGATCGRPLPPCSSRACCSCLPTACCWASGTSPC